MRPLLETAALLAFFTALWLLGLATLLVAGRHIVTVENDGPLWTLAILAAFAVMFAAGWLAWRVIVRARSRNPAP